MPLPPLFVRLCDDAAIFPPGLMPLSEAVPAHLRHRVARYAGLVGPLVVTAAALDDLGALLDPAERLDLAERPDLAERLDLAVTLPDGPGGLPEVLATAATLPVRLRAVEVAMPAKVSADSVSGDSGPAEFFAALDRARESIGDAAVFVEVPRDERGREVIAMCAAHGYSAKFRTGGTRAEMYPDGAELAGSIRAVIDAGVPFKATAGLHHAVRNTDPVTGFEQHGFLNLLLAVDAALRGADEPALADVLAERDADTITRRVAGLDDRAAREVRARFRSYGTCSVRDPLTELMEVGLAPASVLSVQEATA